MINTVRPVKGIRFNYTPSTELLDLLNTFRTMVNEAIHICIAENIKGRLRLMYRIYTEFKKYGLLTCYAYSVAEVAYSIVKKHKRWHRKPFAKHLMLKMGYDSYTIKRNRLSLPFKRGKRIYINLQYGDYQRSYLMDKTLKRGSVTITDRTIVIAFSKEIPVIEPLSKVGYDLNEKSIVGSDGSRYDLSDVARLRTEYKERRSKYYQRNSHDNRLKKKFSSNSREKERAKQALHRVSTAIVNKAKESSGGIILENIKNILLKHRRGSKESRTLRGRLHTWSFNELQRQIQYKAEWNGLPVEYVSPTNTSRICSECGHLNKDLKYEREWQCPCGVINDRDLNASKNIVSRSKLECLPMVQAGAGGK